MRYPLRSMNPQMITRFHLGAVRDEIEALEGGDWNQHPYRTKMPRSPHREADDIILRFQDIELAIKDRRSYRQGGCEDRRPPSPVVDDLEAVPYPMWWQLTETRALVYRMARQFSAGRIGRAVITRLRPGARVYPHVDDGANADYYDRFQVCVAANKDCIFTVHGLGYGFHQGEIWWFDNRFEHSVVNNGSTDRITLVLDLRVESEGDGWRNAKASDRRAAGAAAA